MAVDFETHVKSCLASLKERQSKAALVHGRNKDIEKFYDIWRGSPGWLPYYYIANGQKIEAKLKTLNTPRYICRTWANNYANEDTQITIPGDKYNDRLQQILASTNLFGRFNNFAEMFMGLGIGATVVETEAMVDEDGKIIKSNEPIKIKMVPGRRVIPITVDDGEVTECAFVSYFTGGARLTIHYLGDDGKYNLAIFKAKGDGRGNYSFESEYSNIKLDTIPLFQIWHPNLTDEDEVDKCFGTSCLSTALDAFKSIDLGYTAYYKEIKLGQKIKVISTDQIEYDENGNEVHPFDENDESIIVLKNASDVGSQVQEVNGELRIDAITKYINTNLNCAAMLCGLGQTQFEFDGGAGRPIQTATGVIAKQTELYRNVVKQENLATDCFRKLVNAIAYVNNTFCKAQQIKINSLEDIQVLYDDNIVEDTASKKDAELKEVQAGVMSIAEFRSHWYDEDYDSAVKFVQENGLLLDKYILALQSNAITPEIFIELAFGENYKHKNELLEYINQSYGIEALKQKKMNPLTGFEDETEEDEEEDPKKEEDKDDE